VDASRQHAMMFIARRPSDITLHLGDMSNSVWRVVTMT
jgi:hypothetical protein